MRMTGKQLKKLLLESGWRLDRISGSHHIMIKDGRRSIPVPNHGNVDLPKGLVHAVLKQAGIRNKNAFVSCTHKEGRGRLPGDLPRFRKCYDLRADDGGSPA
ncbi:type II toxin-antitoxin system HicA family toxin [Geomonas oryzisoli]|uniref:Type II toxin-antitoxin system HicA family toxin n=1 Tax=Geomonas oryzisoli TaxID=2847992 RepID=A0ABX8JJZ1_9BACT|nr:type II toxin-antitoxin system HicA family toxin [Geomonas oryzisoli]